MLFLFKLLITGASIYAGLKGHQHNKPLKQEKQTYTDSANILPDDFQALADISIDDKTNREHLEKTTDRNLAVAGSSLALTSVGVLTSNPLLVPLAIPGLIYIGVPMVEDAYRAVFHDHKVRASILDAVSISAMLATGNLLVCALAASLLTGSEKLLLKTEDDSRKNLTNIFGEQPKFVWILTDNVEVEIPFEQVKAGDIIVVNAGEHIPSDGVIVKGIASIDQHQLTGEAQPAEKTLGDSVFAGTVVLSGRLNIRVEKAGADTVIAQLGEILSRTADFKTSIQSKGRVIADKAVVPTLALSAMAVPLGATHALAVLNSGFGYNMRLIAPISMLNFLSIASKEGILIKDGRSLELLGKTDTVVFDKTGTLTLVEPDIAKIYSYNNFTEVEVLRFAAAAEYRQTHPIAKAVLEAAKERKIDLPQIEHVKYEVGYGIKADFEDHSVKVGNIRFMIMEGIFVPDGISVHQSNSNEEGTTIIYVAVDNQLSGAIELKAAIRPEVKLIVQTLKQRGKKIYIISGDHEKPTRKLASDLGIDHYFSEVLPEDKANLIKKLQDSGHSVCFVGDGINDAIALKKANVSISLRGASTIATDSAQIVFMGTNLDKLIPLFDLASKFDSNINISLMTTIIPGAICVGGAFFLGFGIVSSVMLYNVGLVSGVGNAMLPRLHYKKLSP
ncbi:MAG: heavy metal translocating P-type ATPase [Desulfamplus sp.]|nr:heavy metal translocating P-type ATPase [Desulfamplus sp.]